MEKRAACYIRVSTSDQAEFSPAAQLKAIKKYAKDNRITLLSKHIYIDEASGKTTDKRTAFMKMISNARKKPREFDLILVHKFDRFARSREDSVVFKSILKKEAGIRVVSITESIDDDKFSVILEAMLEAMAEYYSLNLAEEVKKGMTEKAQRGGFQATPPFGYIISQKALIPHEHEAIVVKAIFNQYAYESLSLRAIAEQLNTIGVRTKRGNLFDGRGISYILQNPVYTGKTRWTPDGKTDRNFSNPSSIIASGDFPPIISTELWQMANKRLKAEGILHSNRQHTSARINTWLKGLIKCGNCGGLLVSNGTPYLQCNRYAKGQCSVSHSINYVYLEKLIANRLSQDYQGELIINPVYEKQKNGGDADFFRMQISDIEKKLNRLQEAYLSGVDELSEYQAKKRILLEQKKAIQHCLENIKGPDTPKPLQDTFSFSSIELFFMSDKVSVISKHRAAHLLIKDIVFDKAQGLITINYQRDFGF